MLRISCCSSFALLRRWLAADGLKMLCACAALGIGIRSAEAQPMKSAQSSSTSPLAIDLQSSAVDLQLNRLASDRPRNARSSAEAVPSATGQSHFLFASVSTSRNTSREPQNAPISDAVANSIVEPSLYGQSDAARASQATADTAPVYTYSILNGHTVACQAACCWPLAKLLDQRAATIRAGAADRHEGEQRSGALQASFLRRQAARQRDVAAAAALRTYYGWIANREQLAIAMSASELQREQLATQSALIDRGVAVEDPTELERQGLELRDKLIQLQANDRQFAQTLLQLTCCTSDPRAVSVEALEIRRAALACDQLIDFAIRHRQDYLAYVELCQCLDEATARAVADLLTPLVGGIGLGLLELNCIQKLCLTAHGSDAFEYVSRELRTAVQLQRRLIEQSVCEKCLALGVAYERVEIAQQILLTWDERIEALHRLSELGAARGEALATARAEQLQARSTLISRQLSAKLAEVDLAEAIGELALRCCRGEPWLKL